MRTFIFIMVALLCNYCTGSHTSAYGRRDPKSFYIYFGGGFSHIDRTRDDTVTFALNGVELFRKKILISDLSAGAVFDSRYRIKNDSIYDIGGGQENVITPMPISRYMDIKLTKNRMDSQVVIDMNKGQILVINNHNRKNPDGVIEPTITFDQFHIGAKNVFY